MEIGITDPNYLVNGTICDQELSKAVTDFQEGNHTIVTCASHGDLGEGADWPVVILTIAGFYFSGKPILENFDAWVEMGKRINRFIERSRNRKLATYIDNESAIALAIAIVSEKLRDGEIIVEVTCSSHGFPLHRGAAIAKIEFYRDQTFCVIVSTIIDSSLQCCNSDWIIVIHSDSVVETELVKDWIR